MKLRKFQSEYVVVGYGWIITNKPCPRFPLFCTYVVSALLPFFLSSTMTLMGIPCILPLNTCSFRCYCFPQTDYDHEGFLTCYRVEYSRKLRKVSYDCKDGFLSLELLSCRLEECRILELYVLY